MGSVGVHALPTSTAVLLLCQLRFIGLLGFTGLLWDGVAMEDVQKLGSWNQTCTAHNTG